MVVGVDFIPDMGADIVFIGVNRYRIYCRRVF